MFVKIDSFYNYIEFIDYLNKFLGKKRNLKIFSFDEK